MTEPPIVLEDRQGSTTILTLNRPERRNALSMPMREALMAAVDRAESDRGVRAVVITGAGGNFCAGGDIAAMNQRDVAASRDRFRFGHRMVRAVMASSKPYLAAVEGWAVGAGLGMALICDTVVAAEDAGFGAGFGKIGLIPDWGLLHTLPRRIGEAKARQMVLYCETMRAPEALAIGLVDHTAPKGEALATALKRAEALANIAPQSIAMCKSYFVQGLAETLEWERNSQALVSLTADHAEGKAAFLEKRAPNFQGS
ncbi:MAG: enoyl-CoA hydratase [Rhodospirillales bacterium 70-18]|nr:enoyl-CoA hydratase/isomerase family protein [Rhodospirillales bacterium]OJY71784.1 MAG: enoyl-CoA hydratase [Rhodospirillales bacterium 70-18]